MRKGMSGFTIVELLIVIVVIAILVAISVVAYTGIQARANDSRRLSDVAEIRKALALYKADHGNYPPTAPNPGVSTWEISSDPGFLSSLSDYTNGKVFSPPGTGGLYRYKSFPAGHNGCPASLGPHYILWVQGMQAQSGGAVLETNGCDAQTAFSSTYR
jgi:prepilin-type N-terminal cleavage/methylation domain-containing protein